MTKFTPILPGIVAFLQVTAFLQPAQAQPAIPPPFIRDGLVYSYPLQGDAKDQNRIGPTGQLLFGSYFTNHPDGPWPQAAVFNGTGALIHIGKDDAHDPNRVLTWSLWAKPNGLSEGIFFYDDDANFAGDRWIGMHADGTIYEDDTTANNIAGVLNGPALLPNQWNHVVFTASNTGKALYLNGVQVATNNATLPEHSGRSELVLGSGYLNGQPYIHYFKGSLAGFRVYNRPLSTNEVSELYTYELARDKQVPAWPATASATVASGFLVNANVIDGGSGYTNTPSVYVYGTGSNAVLSATMTGGVVQSIEVINPGRGYGAGGTLIFIDPPQPLPPAIPKGQALLSGSGVGGVQITDYGFGYTIPPLILFIGGGGTGAEGIAQVFHGRVVGVTVTNPGTGYRTAPKVAFTPPGSSALLSLAVSAVKVTAAVAVGTRYQLVSTVDFATWSPVGEPFVAATDYFSQDVVVSETARYFALVVVP
jgi:hypothetical protein